MISGELFPIVVQVLYGFAQVIGPEHVLASRVAFQVTERGSVVELQFRLQFEATLVGRAKIERTAVETIPLWNALETGYQKGWEAAERFVRLAAENSYLVLPDGYELVEVSDVDSLHDDFACLNAAGCFIVLPTGTGEGAAAVKYGPGYCQFRRETAENWGQVGWFYGANRAEAIQSFLDHLEEDARLKEARAAKANAS